MNRTPAIIIMCKAPIAGTVKTRLLPFLSAEQAASLAASFALDTVWKAQLLSSYVFVAFAPSDAKHTLKTFLPKHLHWMPQRGNDLGERMHNALVYAAQHECSPLVVLGTDSPTLPLEYIEKAAAVLSNNGADVVLGKTEDGGYYLLGVNSPNLQLFENVEWSSPRTFEQTANNIEKLGLRLEVLPLWYDVDFPEDLKRLQKEVLDDENAALPATQTARWLRQNEDLFV